MVMWMTGGGLCTKKLCVVKGIKGDKRIKSLCQTRHM